MMIDYAYVQGLEKDNALLEKENQQLKSQLKQKDEVIEKIRNKVEWLKENVFMEERNLTSDFEEILEILDEENK